VLALFLGLLIGFVFSVLGAGGGIVAVPALLVLFSLSLADASAAALATVFRASARQRAQGRALHVPRGGRPQGAPEPCALRGASALESPK
jgi:hypothetical protein